MDHLFPSIIYNHNHKYSKVAFGNLDLDLELKLIDLK